MTRMLSGNEDFLAYHHLTLILGDTKRYMGRVSHLQIMDVPGGLAREGTTHAVRFWDGENLRELLGKVHDVPEETALILDMGEGKSYRFRRLDVQDLAAVLQ